MRARRARRARCAVSADADANGDAGADADDDGEAGRASDARLALASNGLNVYNTSAMVADIDATPRCLGSSAFALYPPLAMPSNSPDLVM